MLYTVYDDSKAVTEEKESPETKSARFFGVGCGGCGRRGPWNSGLSDIYRATVDPVAFFLIQWNLSCWFYVSP